MSNAVETRHYMPLLVRNNLCLSIAALLGWIIAVGRRAIWQDPVEAGQVLAGMVTYPPDNPVYIYSVKMWSLLNQLAAIILSAGGSEFVATLVIAGMIGAVSFAGIYLIVEAISGNRSVALLTPLLMYSLSLVGASGAYPISLLGSCSSYGIIGLAATLLAIGLLATGRYRTGAFLAGLMPSVHPGWGVFCILIASVAVVANLRRLRPQLPRLLGFFLLGAAVTGTSLGWHLHHLPRIQGIDPALRQRYLNAFVRHFDWHRNAGGWTQPNVLFCALLTVIAASGVRMKNALPAARIVFVALIASVLATFLLVLATTCVPFLAFLKVVIPWRFTNYANISLLPLSFGLLAADFPDRPRLRSLCLIALLAIAFAMRLLGMDETNLLYLSILVLLLGLVVLKLPDLPEAPFRHIRRGRTVIVYAALALLLFRQVVPGVVALSTGSITLSDRTNTEILRTISLRPGTLLTSGGMHLFQVATRRPVLLDGGALDMFNYIPETGPRFNEILKRVYGLDMLVKPPDEAHYHGDLTYAHKQLWERRTRQEWESIRNEFGVTDILTPIDWQLQLPVVAREETGFTDMPLIGSCDLNPLSCSNSGLALYTIPVATEGACR